MASKNKTVDNQATDGYVIHMNNIASMLLGILSLETCQLVALGFAGRALRMEEIGRVAGASADQMRKAMRSLVDAGLVKRTGNTRGTRYQAVGL